MTTKSTEIFYFSASGNSLALARDIAEKTDGKLIAIPSVINKETIKTDADVVGIVFPVYYATNDCGIPLIVERFVNKLEDIDSKYIFAVCTHSGMPGETIENLRKLIKSRGGELAAGFIVKMGSKKIAEKEQQKMLVNQKKKAVEVCEYVALQKRGKFETRGILRKIVFAPLLFLLIKPVFSRRYRKLSNIKQHLPFMELVPFADRSFQCDDKKCTGCGICAQVCPVSNIKMVNDRPEWQHHCETCYACYGWCPNAAIHGKIVEYNDQRHHPDVKLSDMITK
jgi:Pyruvate/2-oxoacid:ferredoxin oxidoreductase delta subunit/flavodoxin